MYTRDEVTTGRMEREKKRRSGSRTKCKVNDDYDIRVKQLELPGSGESMRNLTTTGLGEKK